MNALPVFLPDGFSPVVSVGDTISAGGIIAHYTSPDEHIVNIPTELEIPLQKVKHVLKKNPGDRVHEGDVIAVKKNFFGSEQAAIISQVEGTVSRYERNTGNLVIKTMSQSPIQKIISPVDGTIALCDNKQIVISTISESVAGRKAIGESREGEVFILEASFADEDGDNLANVLYHLDNRAIGKIVIGGEFTREMLAKAVGIGAIGMVGTKIEEYDLAYIAERNKEIPVLEIETEQITHIRTWKNARVYLDTQAKTLLKIKV